MTFDRIKRAPGTTRFGTLVALVQLLGGPFASGIESVYLTGVPDYDWHGGCFGTATGNLMGYWDRHGFPNFYTGPTAGGVAPLHSFGFNAGIRSMWASAAGLDQRPLNQPGHTDDYWIDYESALPDPYRTAGRREHTPDCLGDFIGLSQQKWSNLNGECDGNLDAYCVNFFAHDGSRRVNYTPSDPGGGPIPDIQSGLRAWTRFRGSTADTFSQLSDFNPDSPTGQGFAFADLKAEIDAGYPVLLFMQEFGVFSRSIGSLSKQNPIIHALLAYGYLIDDNGQEYVRYRTSWASGDRQFSAWTSDNWTPNGELNLPLRGVIGYRPRPALLGVQRTANGLRLTWEGPLGTLRDDTTDLERPLHAYVVERTASLTNPEWQTATSPVVGLETVLPDCCEETSFFRVRLVAPAREP